MSETNKIPWPGFENFFEFVSFQNNVYTLKCRLCNNNYKGDKSSHGNFKKHVKVSSATKFNMSLAKCSIDFFLQSRHIGVFPSFEKEIAKAKAALNVQCGPPAKRQRSESSNQLESDQISFVSQKLLDESILEYFIDEMVS